MLPRKEKYPQLNNYHNTRHIVHDLKKEGSSDEGVVKIAMKTDRIIVTKNIRHFRDLGKKIQN
jgi:predicted nuclease of predicted toxin-antitoxin system